MRSSVLACVLSFVLGVGIASCARTDSQNSHAAHVTPPTPAPAAEPRSGVTAEAYDYDEDDGCDEYRAEVERLENQILDAQIAMLGLASEIDTLAGHVQELDSEVDSFGFDNWRSVVPQVTDTTYQVVSSTNDVEAALEELKAALE